MNPRNLARLKTLTEARGEDVEVIDLVCRVAWPETECGVLLFFKRSGYRDPLL